MTDHHETPERCPSCFGSGKNGPKCITLVMYGECNCGCDVCSQCGGSGDQEVAVNG